ncbi:phytoene/squalene synthase family protein [Roseixanthobacter glucoisosaccharinicivorans]|uniref:phytoene/squalene synthase family protein n=1 Tax=Roseixanthobacter glucoisosaccharinicivorans TaxID=3119923 RepID=UPI00372C1CA5
MSEEAGASGAPDLETAYSHCADLIRTHDRDRFLAALFAAASPRRHLMALYAFNLEVARVREVVREALPGEMRLQWWREIIEGLGRGDVSGHPVAAAMLDTIAACDLPRGALLNLIDARTFDLYDDAMPTLNDLEGYAGETSSVLIQLGATILLGRADPALADAAGHAGVAIALTGLMRALPLHAGRGQCFLPLDILQRHGLTREDVVKRNAGPGLAAALGELRARATHHVKAAQAALTRVPAQAVPAFLPLALVPGDLKALARASDPFTRIVGLAPFVRAWTLWRAAAKARAGRDWITLPAA